jgi:hypothetical protein
LNSSRIGTCVPPVSVIAGLVSPGSAFTPRSAYHALMTRLPLTHRRTPSSDRVKNVIWLSPVPGTVTVPSQRAVKYWSSVTTALMLR